MTRILALIVGLAILSSAQPGIQSSRKRDGLAGAVRSVRSLVKSTNHGKELPAQGATITEYDERGLRTTRLHFDPSGLLSRTETRTYDRFQRIVRETTTVADGRVRTTVQYKYDDHQKTTEVSKYDAHLSLISRETYQFESNHDRDREDYSASWYSPNRIAKWIEYTSYDPKGSLVHRITTNITMAEMKREETHFAPGDSGWYKSNGARSVYLFNNDGDIIRRTLWTTTGTKSLDERLIYLRPGLPSQVSEQVANSWKNSATYAYEFDSRGNWIKREISMPAGTRTEYRTISYY